MYNDNIIFNLKEFLEGISKLTHGFFLSGFFNAQLHQNTSYSSSYIISFIYMYLLATLISMMYEYIIFSVSPKDCNTNKACVWDKVYQECTTTPVLPER